MTEPDPVDLAYDQLHIGPRDEFDHVMSAFCPCGPELEDESTQQVNESDDEPIRVVCYTHKPMPGVTS